MSDDVYQFVSNLWEHKPVVVILFLGGFALFMLSIINTFRHRRQLKKRHRITRHH